MSDADNRKHQTLGLNDDLDLTLGNLSKAGINRVFRGSVDDARIIGQKKNSAQKFLDNLQGIKDAITTTVQAHIEAAKLNNEVKAQLLTGQAEINTSSFELTQAAAAAQLTNESLYYKGLALKQDTAQKSEMTRVMYGARSELSQMTHVQRLTQALIELDNQVTTNQVSVDRAKEQWQVSQGLAGADKKVINKSFATVQSQNFQSRSPGSDSIDYAKSSSNLFTKAIAAGKDMLGI